MKVEQMDTTKEAIKRILEQASNESRPWHSQTSHKIAVGIFFMDCLGITEQADRDAVMKQWMATPSAFGCNSSAMGQALGRKPTKQSVEEAFSGF